MDSITMDRKVVNLLPPKDISAAAFSTAYVNMENWGHVDFIVVTGANGAGTKAVTLKEALNKSGSSATTLTAVGHYYSNVAAAASASIDNDTYVKTTLTSGAFNIAASTDNQSYIIPVDNDQLNGALAKTHVGVGIATTSALAIVGCVAILSQPRYGKLNSPTALD